MDIYIYLLFLLFPLRGEGRPDCDSFEDCETCTQHKSWNGHTCRWCPLDRECHAYGSLVNSCRKDQNIKWSFLCPEAEKSYGIYNPEMAYLATLLSALAYSDNPTKCIDSILLDSGFELHQAVGQRCEDLPLFEYEECYAYTAISHAKKMIVLSFRGTTTIRGNQQLYDEIVSVLSTPKSSFMIGGEVQYYFKNVFNKLSPCVHQSINELVTRYSDYDVMVTGHSLGGAVASLSAAALIYTGIVPDNKLSLYTFGMPRVGDKEYALNHDKIVNNSWRVVHRRDVVAHLPTCNLLFGCRVTTNGPYHHRTEIFYPDSAMTTSSYYKQCEGNEDDKCSDGTVTGNVCVPLVDMDKCIDDHKKYFEIPVGTYCSERGAGRKRRDSGRSLMWEKLSSKRCTRINLINATIIDFHNGTERPTGIEHTTRKQISTNKNTGHSTSEASEQKLAATLVFFLIFDICGSVSFSVLFSLKTK